MTHLTRDAAGIYRETTDVVCSQCATRVPHWFCSQALPLRSDDDKDTKRTAFGAWPNHRVICLACQHRLTDWPVVVGSHQACINAHITPARSDDYDANSSLRVGLFNAKMAVPDYEEPKAYITRTGHLKLVEAWFTSCFNTWNERQRLPDPAFETWLQVDAIDFAYVRVATSAAGAGGDVGPFVSRLAIGISPATRILTSEVWRQLVTRLSPVQRYRLEQTLDFVAGLYRFETPDFTSADVAQAHAMATATEPSA